jgi:hypothetical protein
LRVLKACSPAHPLSRDPSTQGGVSSPAATVSLRRRPSSAQHSLREGSGHLVAHAYSGLSGLEAGISAIRRSGFHRHFHAQSAAGSEVRATGGCWTPSPPPRTTKRVLVERMSAFPRTIAILRPDNWPVLARESGSLPDRDRHAPPQSRFASILA